MCWRRSRGLPGSSATGRFPWEILARQAARVVVGGALPRAAEVGEDILMPVRAVKLAGHGARSAAMHRTMARTPQSCAPSNAISSRSQKQRQRPVGSLQADRSHPFSMTDPAKDHRSRRTDPGAGALSAGTGGDQPPEVTLDLTRGPRRLGRAHRRPQHPISTPPPTPHPPQAPPAPTLNSSDTTPTRLSHQAVATTSRIHGSSKLSDLLLQHP